MRKLSHILLSFIIVTSLAGCSPKKYDLIVYGGTAAGLMAARGAADGGLNVLVVEPSARIGGLTTALWVSIEYAPTHIAGMPVAVCICCHASRHAETDI